MTESDGLWEHLRPWERAFLIVWLALLIQAPIVIGVVDVGVRCGWWKG